MAHSDVGGAAMATGIGQGLVTFAGGFLIAAWGFSNFFLASGMLTLVAGVVFWAYFRSSARAAAPSEVVAAQAAAQASAEPEVLVIQ